MKLPNCKMNLHRKLFLLLVAVGIVAFLIAGAVSLAGMYQVNKGVQGASDQLSRNTATFTETFAEDMAKTHLTALTAEKAARIGQEMDVLMEDAKYIADSLTRILKHPGDYKMRVLPDPLRDEIPSGRAYLHFSRRMRQQYGNDAFANERGIASNIADDLVLEAEYYTGVFAGSEHGYLVAADVTKDRSAKQFSQKFLDGYDPREMEWYKLGKTANGPAHTDVYVDSNGVRCVTCVMPYYDANGFAGVVGIDCNPDEFFKVMGENLIIGTDRQEGSSFILDRSAGHIVFSSRNEGDLAITRELKDLRKHSEKSLAQAAADMAAGNSGMRLVNVDGETFYLAYAPIDSSDWSLGILNKQTDILYPAVYARNNVLFQMEGFTETLHSLFGSMIRWAVLFFLLLLVGLFFISAALSRKLVQPILEVIDGVREIARGNLDKKIAINRNDEIAYLADSVNEMTDDLKEHIQSLSRMTAEKERIATELSVATSIQEGMLPRIEGPFAAHKGFDLFATMDPAKEVGGDFYDFYMLDDRHLAVTIADVSGKGVPAALFMVIAKTILKNSMLAAGADADYAAVVEQANRQLCENNEEMLFVTVFLGVLDIRTGRFSYVNCGHNPPLLQRKAAGDFMYIRGKNKNLMMGADEGVVFHGEVLQLYAGDSLFFYTDGVTEAMDEAGSVYSEGRLQETLVRIDADGSVPVTEVLAGVREDIRTYVGAAEQFDDITMLGLRYLG